MHNCLLVRVLSCMYSLVISERFHRPEALSTKFAEILGVAVHVHVLPQASAVLAELSA